jgi:hypothetical protein
VRAAVRCCWQECVLPLCNVFNCTGLMHGGQGAVSQNGTLVKSRALMCHLGCRYPAATTAHYHNPIYHHCNGISSLCQSSLIMVVKCGFIYLFYRLRRDVSLESTVSLEYLTLMYTCSSLQGLIHMRSVDQLKPIIMGIKSVQSLGVLI